MANHIIVDDNQAVEGNFIGWDYAHYGDYIGFYEDKTIWKDKDTKGMKRWTTQEIFEEVKDACYQLKQLEEESPADKILKSWGMKKMKMK